jgi:hypothetical protein
MPASRMERSSAAVDIVARIPIKRPVKRLMAPTYQVGKILSSCVFALLPSAPLFSMMAVTKRPEN